MISFKGPSKINLIRFYHHSTIFFLFTSLFLIISLFLSILAFYFLVIFFPFVLSSIFLVIRASSFWVPLTQCSTVCRRFRSISRSESSASHSCPPSRSPCRPPNSRRACCSPRRVPCRSGWCWGGCSSPLLFWGAWFCPQGSWFSTSSRTPSRWTDSLHSFCLHEHLW